MNIAVNPHTPPRVSIKKAPSSDPRKKRENACPEDEYVATIRDDEGKLICDDGSRDMYFHQTEFDKSIPKKSSFLDGVWCCEKKKSYYSTQSNKKKEAIDRSYSLFMEKHEQHKKNLAMRAYRNLSNENRNFKFPVPSLPKNHKSHNKSHTRMPHKQNTEKDIYPNREILYSNNSNNSQNSQNSNNHHNNNNALFALGDVNPGEWNDLYGTPPGEHILHENITSMKRKRTKKSSRKRSRSRSKRRKTKRRKNASEKQ